MYVEEIFCLLILKVICQILLLVVNVVMCVLGYVFVINVILILCNKNFFFYIKIHELYYLSACTYMIVDSHVQCHGWDF